MSIRLIANFKKSHPGILQEPNEKLRKLSDHINTIDSSVKEVSESLISTLLKLDKRYNPWLGLAAPQIGHNKRIIALKKKHHDYLIMINPEILEQKFFLPTISACYSLTGLYAVWSPHWMKLTYQSLSGKNYTQVFRGGNAVVLKQEIDHLNGKLICD